MESVRRLVEITNDLERQIPLGTLFFANTPRLPMDGIDAPDGWKWFHPPWSGSNVPLFPVSHGAGELCSLSPLLVDLTYLFERQHIRATYKTVRSGCGKITVMRVYVLPGDVDGSRFLVEYRNNIRRGKSPNWHENKYKTIMKQLLTVLDYSIESWNIDEETPLLPHPSLIFSALRPFTEFHAKELGVHDYNDSSNIDYHITRLLTSKPFSTVCKGQLQSLETRLSDVYNSINFTIDPSSEYLNEARGLKGLKSALYNYQIESVAKMYMNESTESHNLMPHILQVHNRQNPVYFDTISFTFSQGPEFYTSPRGGILAENMGLGKTLICLALICLTKDESSTPPEQYSGRDFRDHQVVSLMDQCVRFINRRAIPWRKHLDGLPEACIKKLEDNPGYFYMKKDESSSRRFLSRSRPIIQQEKLLLTTATLIVCPDNLFHQWTIEIEKHIKEDTLKVNYIASSKRILPSASELSKYDIVLMCVSAFVAQDPSTSVLTKIYWKRFIIDEGHSMNQRSTRAVDISKEIKVERRWAVTGTPTAGMTKLHMNETDDQSHGDTYTVKRSFSARDDLSRLGTLVYNFFQIEPWLSKHDLWTKNLVKPFIEDRWGSTHALTGLVSDLIVRHSVDQIELDVTLPPLIHKPVFLTPSFHNRLSVNLFVAVLAINAVSSEREDKDYMFHPASKSDLRRLVMNLQRATFYWTGFSIDDLNNMMYISQVCLDKKRDDGSDYYNSEDRVLLQNCINTCKLSLSNQLWRTVSTIHEMAYYISGLPKLYSNNFSIGRFHSDISVLGSPQIYSMQKFYYRNRFSELSMNDEKMSSYSDVFWKDYWREATKKNAERVKKNDGQPIDVHRVNTELDHQEKMALKSSPKTKTSFDDPELIMSEGGRVNFMKSVTNTPEPSSISDAKTSRILGSSSAKLSYMVAKLLENQYSGLKSIVFFEFEDSAYYLSEALDILGLDYTLYATSVSKFERTMSIENFTNKKGGHALIMDLKLASHGLTITAATRVYFLSPVWKRSVEAQAIKRAHRIGQTSSVHVETLVLKGTLEEEMFKRRADGQDDSHRSVSEDLHIQEYISKFEFLQIGERAPYTEFKSHKVAGMVGSINQKMFEEEELPEPHGVAVKERLHWSIPVFSKLSQEKITEAATRASSYVRPLKIVSELIDIDELDGRSKKTVKRSSSSTPPPVGKREPPKTPKSKIVRFDENHPSAKKVRFV